MPLLSHSNSISYGVRDYRHRISHISPNAKKIIISRTIGRFGRGVNQTIFNLFLISLGYSTTFVGGLLSLGGYIMAIGALASAPATQRIGSRNTMIISTIIIAITSSIQLGFPVPLFLLIGAIGSNIGQALTITAYSPLMTENSTAYERTHLFGTSQALSIGNSFVGSFLSGYLPGWIALTLALPVDSALAFQLALIAWIIPLFLSIPPLLFIRKEADPPNSDIMNALEHDNHIATPSSPSQPIEPQGRKVVVAQFAITSGIIGLGAGFLVPLLNVFFWEFYNLPTHIVGITTALGQGTMATSVFLSPMLSTRIGKVRTSLITRLISLPFLILLIMIINPIVAIFAYLMRGLLMNAGLPVDSTLRMELMPSSWRPNMSGIHSASSQFSRSIGTQITGILYDQGLYLTPFWYTLGLYSFGTLLFGIFFHNSEKLLEEELGVKAKEPPQPSEPVWSEAP